MSNIMLKLQGEALTITLPEEVRDELGLRPGQQMAVSAVDGGLRLVPLDDELTRQLRFVDEVLAEQADALRVLASR